MQGSRLFAATEWAALATNLIVLKLYDLDSPERDDSGTEAVWESLARESLAEAAEGVLRSERTLERLLRKLRDREERLKVERFRINGHLLPEGFVAERFAEVISERNAGRVAEGFADVFRRRLAARDALALELVDTYRDTLQRALGLLSPDDRHALIDILDMPQWREREAVAPTPVVPPTPEGPGDEGDDDPAEAELTSLPEDATPAVEAPETPPATEIANGQYGPSPEDASDTDSGDDAAVPLAPSPGVEESPDAILWHEDVDSPAEPDWFAADPQMPEVAAPVDDHPAAGSAGLLRLPARGSAQLPEWDPHRHGWPVRGLRKLDVALQKSPCLWVSGPAGCGKSMLLSAFLHQIVQSQRFSGESLFYYRFAEELVSEGDFYTALVQYLQERGATGDPENLRGDLPGAMIAANGRVVLDDLHNVSGELRAVLAGMWSVLSRATGFRGLLLFAGPTPFAESPPDAAHLPYSGLSLSESNTLLRNIWKLVLPLTQGREVARRLGGHGLALLLFRNWWMNETHPDTALDRLLEELPDADGAAGDDPAPLVNLLAERLRESFAQTDERRNGFLELVSRFRVAETERMLEAAYNRSGGIDFQGQLEVLVDRFGLVQYDYQLDRYRLHRFVFDFYAGRGGDPHLGRIQHHQAGRLYADRFQRYQTPSDALEGAWHLRQAERDGEAAALLTGIMGDETLGEVRAGRVLEAAAGIRPETLASEQAAAFLFARGALLVRHHHDAAAERDLEACLRHSPGPAEAAGAAYHLAGIALRRHDWQRAARFARQADDGYRAAGDEAGAAAAALQLAELDFHDGNDDAAVAHIHGALNLFEARGDLRGSVRCYRTLAELHRRRERLGEARTHYRHALDILDRMDERAATATVLGELAAIHESAGEWDAVLDCIAREVHLRRYLPTGPALADALRRLGNAHRATGALAEARTAYHEALALSGEDNDHPGPALLHLELGRLARQQEAWDEALTHFQQAEEAFDALGQERRVAAVQLEMAAVFAIRKEWERALEVYERVLDEREREGDVDGAAEALQAIADICIGQGRLEDARTYLERAGTRRTMGSDHLAAGELELRLGRLAGEGNDGTAMGHFEKALAAFEAGGSDLGRARAHHQIGLIHHRREHLDTAILHLRQAYDLFGKLGDAEGRATSGFHLGNSLHDRGDWDEALERYMDALPEFERLGDLFQMAQTLGNISSIEFEREEYETAIQRQIEILLFFQESHREELVERVLSNLVACHEDLGADRFQPVLHRCLDHISSSGVSWGRHEIIGHDRASSVIRQLFFST